ncbi:MAG: TetR/AcrR family transcriptional regulator [Pseudomonadota bacterium]
MDLRKRRSQEKLQMALAKHLESKTIDEITIGELTETAGVSRQTFYSNFDSKQSILLNRIESLFEKSWVKLESLTQSDEVGREEFVEYCVKSLLEECDKDRALMRAAFTGQAGIQCLSLLKSFISKLIEERILFQFNHNFTANQLDAISNFYAGGIIGVVQGWLLNDGDRDMQSVVRQIGRVIPHGLDGYINQALESKGSDRSGYMPLAASN